MTKVDSWPIPYSALGKSTWTSVSSDHLPQLHHGSALRVWHLVRVLPVPHPFVPLLAPVVRHEYTGCAFLQSYLLLSVQVMPLIPMCVPPQHPAPSRRLNVHSPSYVPCPHHSKSIARSAQPC